MAKKAFLVECNLITRIVIDEDDQDIKVIVDATKDKFIAKVQDELADNISEWYEDIECPCRPEETIYNGDLRFDIEKIKDFDPPIVITKEYDVSNIGDIFLIEVGGTSYCYAEEEDRDADFERLKLIVPNFFK